MATTKKIVETTPAAASSKGAPQSKKTQRPPKRQNVPLFGKENYRWMLIGLVVMALGIFLMAGGKSKDPNVFDPKQVYSFTRITLSPILIIAGFVLEIFAIFRKDPAIDQGATNA